MSCGDYTPTVSSITSGNIVYTGNTSYTPVGTTFTIPTEEALRIMLDPKGGLIVDHGWGTCRIDPRLFKDLMALVALAELGRLVPAEADNAEQR